MGSTHILSLGSSGIGGEQPIAQYLRRIGGVLLRNANNYETKKKNRIRGRGGTMQACEKLKKFA